MSKYNSINDIDNMVINDNLDIGSILLNLIDVDKILHIKDSFWYYMEFHLNILLSINFMAPVLLVYVVLQVVELNTDIILSCIILLSICIILILLNIFLLQSAR